MLEAATALVIVSAAKSLGGAVVGAALADHDVTASFLSTVLKDSSGKLAGPIQRVIEQLTIGTYARRQIEQSPTIVDMLGIAWSEELHSRSPDALTGTFGVPGRQVLQRLSPGWFISIIRHQPPLAISPETPWECIDATGLERELASESANELFLDVDGAEDRQIRQFCASVLGAIPDRVERHYRSLPGVEAHFARIAAERSVNTSTENQHILQRLLRSAQGDDKKEEAIGALRDSCEAMCGWLKLDVFRRECTDSGLPFIPFDETYVEPQCHKRFESDTAPLLSTAREALEGDKGIVVIQAPFGFGKSLSCRKIAAEQAAKFLSGTTEYAPVFIHTPTILSGRASTLEQAVSHHFETVLGLGSAAAAWLWESMSLLLVLDSYDEVVQDSRPAERWIEDIQRAAARSNIRVILATRHYGIRSQWIKREDTVLSIRPFDQDRVEQWLRKTEPWLRHELDAATVAERVGPEICGTPILLLMAAWSWREGGGSLEGKTDLYARFFQKISRGKWTEVQESHPMVERGIDVLDSHAGEGAFRRALGRVAWHQMLSGQRKPHRGALSVTDVEQILRAHYCELDGKQLRDSDIESVTKSMVLSLFFRRSEDADRIKFSHQSFREFLCAEHMVHTLIEDTRRPVPHLSELTLLEVDLGIEECKFASDLLRQLDHGDRERILRTLDRLQEVPFHLTTSRDESFSSHFIPKPHHVQVVRAEENRANALRENAAKLAAAVRWGTGATGPGKLDIGTLFETGLPSTFAKVSAGDITELYYGTRPCALWYCRRTGSIFGLPSRNFKIATEVPQDVVRELQPGKFGIDFSLLSHVWLGTLNGSRWVHLQMMFESPPMEAWLTILSLYELQDTALSTTEDREQQWYTGLGVTPDGRIFPLYTNSGSLSPEFVPYYLRAAFLKAVGEHWDHQIGMTFRHSILPFPYAVGGYSGSEYADLKPILEARTLVSAAPWGAIRKAVVAAATKMKRWEEIASSDEKTRSYISAERVHGGADDA